jgi:CMP-N-acetylneuraminic acid synthetase
MNIMRNEKESVFHQKSWRRKNTSYHNNYVNMFCLHTTSFLKMKIRIKNAVSGFGGRGVNVLASGTQVRRFKPGRRAEKSSARLPSEGK